MRILVQRDCGIQEQAKVNDIVYTHTRTHTYGKRKRKNEEYTVQGGDFSEKIKEWRAVKGGHLKYSTRNIINNVIAMNGVGQVLDLLG